MPVVSAYSESYCVRLLKNGDHWIGKLTGYANIFKVHDIPHAKKVLSLKAMKGDFFQYLCDDGAIYDEKGVKLF